MPFNVYSALSKECHRYIIAWKMSNRLLNKVFNWPPSKTCKSHPLSQYAHLSAVVQVLTACSQKEKPCTFFPYVSRQLSQCTYLSLGIFEIVSDTLFSDYFKLYFKSLQQPMQNLSKTLHIREGACASPEFDWFNNKVFSLPFSLSSLFVFSVFLSLSPPPLPYHSPDFTFHGENVCFVCVIC